MVKVLTGVVVVIGIFFAFGSAKGEYKESKSNVAWQKPDSIEAMMLAEGRPVIVDVYTDWCYYCKVMDATTWRNDSVVNYLHQNFYAAKLDAETKETVKWFGREYAYKPQYKLNTLAIELLRGNIVYPSTVIIPQKGEWQVIPGAMKPSEIELVLKYFGSRANEKMDFGEFQKHFRSRWK